MARSFLRLIDQEGAIIFYKVQNTERGELWTCGTYNFSFEVFKGDDVKNECLHALADENLTPQGRYHWI